MLGFKPGKRGKDKKPAHIKREGNNFAGGGAVSGPGTGISDDISTEVPEGTYIMPADSTEKIGEQQLGSLGQSVPVNLSNGEYQMPPDQVHAVGAQVLDQMRDQTHAPTGQPQSEGEEIFFADGGLVEDPRRISQSRALVPVQQPTQQAAPANSTSRALAPAAAPQPQGRPDFYTNSRGETARGFAPSSSRAVVPSGPAPAPQPGTGVVPAGPVVDHPRAEGIDARTQERLSQARQRDSANWQSQRSAQDARSMGPQPPQESVGSKARGFVNAPGWKGGALAVIPAIAASADGDSTARYAERFGMSEPTGDGSLADIGKFAALRGLGFASDVGSAMTFGLADKLYRDKQEVDTGMMAGSVGGIAGGVGGNKVGSMVGSGLDALARFATRGRYTGNTGQRVGGTVGAVGGGAAGVGVGRELEEQLTRDPSSLPARGVQPQEAPGQPSSYGPDGLPVTQAGPARLDNNITRVGNSFSGNNIREGYTINGEAPAARGIRSPQNEAAVQALFARTPELGDGQGNQQAARGFSAGGPNVTILRDTSRPLTAREIFSMRQDERRENAERSQQSESERLRLDERRLAGQEIAQGFQVRAAQRLERLSEMYESAGTPEEKAAIAEQIRAERGVDRPPRFVVAAGGQVVDPVTQQLVTQPATVFNQQTGEFVQQPRSLPPLAENPQVQQIMNDTSISRDEQARRIRALGYQ